MWFWCSLWGNMYLESYTVPCAMCGAIRMCDIVVSFDRHSNCPAHNAEIIQDWWNNVQCINNCHQWTMNIQTMHNELFVVRTINSQCYFINWHCSTQLLYRYIFVFANAWATCFRSTHANSTMNNRRLSRGNVSFRSAPFECAKIVYTLFGNNPSSTHRYQIFYNIPNHKQINQLCVCVLYENSHVSLN